MRICKGIYFQQKEEIYQVRVFYEGREYYGGSYKDKERAIRERSVLIARIKAGDLEGVYSRRNGPRTDLQDEWLYEDENQIKDPEHRLRFAVLLSSLKDLCRDDDSLEHKKAKNWVAGLTSSEHSFSFDDICTLFRLNPTAVRDRLVYLDENTKERIQATTVPD